MNFGISAQAVKNRNIIALFLLGIAALNILPIEAISPVFILLTGLTLGVFFITVFAPENAGFLLNCFITALGIRVFLSCMFYTTSFILNGDISPGFLFAGDGFSYSQQGWQICRLAEKGIKITIENFMTDPNTANSHWSGNITPYDFFTSHVYSITGYSPISLFFIGSVSGALSGIFIYLLAKEIFSRRIAKTACMFAFFWPSLILWSTQNLKEPIMTMLIGIVLWTAFYAYKHVSVGFGILSVIAALLAFEVSAPIATIMVSAILLGLAFLFFRSLLKNKFVSLLTLVIIIGFVLFVFRSRIFEIMLSKARYSMATASSSSILEFLDYNRSVRAYGNLQFMSKFSIANPVKAFFFAPIGLIYAVFAPFPWQIGSLNQLIAIPETVIFYILIPHTFRGIVFAYKRRFWPAILILLIILAILGFLGLIEGNSGTLFRHRAVAFYLLFMFTAAGLSLRVKSKEVKA